MQNKKLLKSIFLLVTWFVLSSCASTKMYDESERKDSETATIRGMNSWDPLVPSGWSSSVKSVDGIAVPDMGTNVAILPGKHRIEVSCSRPHSIVNSQFLDINAEAGVKYYIGISRFESKCVLLKEMK